MGLLATLLRISAWEDRDRRVTGACYPARLAQLVSFRPGERERPSLKK